MNKAELINAAAEKGKLSKKNVTKAVEAAFDSIVSALKNDDKVQLIGFRNHVDFELAVSFFMLFLIVFFSYNNVTNTKIITERIPQDQPSSIMESSFLRYLGGIIQKHSNDQLFTFSRIEKISRST
ncbi:hypothetical protein CWS01_12080 [Niallia nealsonii]|uniref:DNA-binding protein HU n=1 Tax=Niallia nealsonii TaxID=115979 RepID=A0A2N0Z1M5_9BACI|nr:hypothetical protein CWS01_12080 [Niallia nealsonii]